ncbi:MAG: DUF1819 family protein [Lachnospiraceae bacterium]|jgi:hypothetical protein|nr:DUF1819 family protein [uncultured Lachnoanaerobaculum sp.]RKW51255.1 MAG: DUF1819 family protein [Lachnospiraceae bacterium]
MERKAYSAGAVKMSFWFMEFRKVVGLMAEGKTLKEIKEINKKENIFGAPTILRSEQIFNTVSGRIKMLNKSFISVFQDSDVTTQKLFALIAALSYDTLFFDFVYEVIREKLIIGSNTFTESDIRIFFKDKQLQSEKVAKWTDPTIIRLGRSYKTMLFEAGLIDKGKTERKIIKPILDPAMEYWLKDHSMEAYIMALTGVG